MKKIVVALGSLAAVGILMAVAAQIASGVDYSIQESAGLQPGYAPEWTVTLTYVGLALFAITVLAGVIFGIFHLVRRQQKA